jgi:hypothetical protein
VTPAVGDAFGVPEAVLGALLEPPLFPATPVGFGEAVGVLLDTRTASSLPVIVVWLPSSVTPSHWDLFRCMEALTVPPRAPDLPPRNHAAIDFLPLATVSRLRAAAILRGRMVEGGKIIALNGLQKT